MELTIDQVKKLLNAFTEGKDEINMFGHVFSKDDVKDAKDKILEFKDQIFDGIGMDSEFSIIPVLDWSEFGSGAKGSLIDAALVSSNKISGAASRHANAINAMKNSEHDEKDSGPNAKNVSITFNQKNESPKALPASEIWRHTKNQLSQLKQVNYEF